VTVQVLEVSIMYEISDCPESPDVEYPPPPSSSKLSFSSLSQQNAGGSSVNYNGKVSVALGHASSSLCPGRAVVMAVDVKNVFLTFLKNFGHVFKRFLNFYLNVFLHLWLWPVAKVENSR